MRISFLSKAKTLLFSCVLLLGANIISSQNLAIGTPVLNFTKACASSTFNTYSLSFTFFPTSTLQPSNQFIIELSNAVGSFASPTPLTTISSNVSPVNASFSFPTNVSGENYIIRVRSTAPVAISAQSVGFAAYYAIHNTPFSINNNVGTALVCDGGFTLLSIDNNASSPTNFPGLIYKWFRDFAVIPGATGPTLNVTDAGDYYVIADYGEQLNMKA